MSKIPSWANWPPARKRNLEDALKTAVKSAPNLELTHEVIENEVAVMYPKLDIEDDDDHVLITEIYDHYRRLGAVD